MDHGIVFVKKPVGMTSYDVIRILKRTFNTNKIGHAGTLDPFASGLLIIGVNEGTKVLPYLENENKEYIAELTLGALTDTFDVTGKVIDKKTIKKHTREEIDEALHSFVGEINQTPPLYSAIKVKGKPLYSYARNNEKIKIKPRKQIIYDVRLIHATNHKIYFYVKCNKGTYIRSLGVDFAKKLNELGYLSNLKRIAIGPYHILNVKNPNQINKRHLISIQDALKMKKINYLDKTKIKNGVPIKLNCNDELVLIINQEKALAIYRYNPNDKLYHCDRGFFYEGV